MEFNKYSHDNLLKFNDISKSFGQALKDISILALPNLLIFVLTNLNDMTSLIVVSQTGREDFISVVGVSTMIVGMFGLQPLFAISTSLDTLIAQSYGKGDYKACGNYLNKAVSLLLLSCTPSFICIFFTKSILSLMGFHEEIATMSGIYCSRMCIFIFASVTFYMFNRFLNAQKIAYPQMIIIGTTSLLHPLWCYIFVFLLDYGCYGLNYAYTITAILNLTSILCYIYFSQCSNRIFVLPSLEIFNEYREFLKIACAGVAMSVLEWWGYYLLMLLGGYLTPLSLATNQILINVDVFFYMIPSGVGSALTALVGNSLGQRNTKEAKLYSFVSTVLTIVIATSLVLVFLFFRRTIAAVYTPNTDIQELYTKVIVICLFSFFCDAFQGVLSRIFVAQARQIYATITNFVVYYFFLIPIGCFFVIYLGWDIYGLWIAACLGFGAITVVYLVILYFQNWELLAEKISMRNKMEVLYSDKEIV
jgi:MATE family multidrug resistance protein